MSTPTGSSACPSSQWPESRPIAGVSAKIEETGGFSSRSTLTRSAVPGMHGWQKQTDNRKGYIVIDGPDFQWQLEYLPQLDMGGARKFMTAVNTAGRTAALAAAPPSAAAPDPWISCASSPSYATQAS